MMCHNQLKAKKEAFDWETELYSDCWENYREMIDHQMKAAIEKDIKEVACTNIFFLHWRLSNEKKEIEKFTINLLKLQ